MNPYKLIVAPSLKVLVVSSLCLTACGANKQQIGTVGGAAAGAAAGRAIGGKGSGGYIGLILGAIAGGYLGNMIGKSLDEKDRSRIYDTTNQALGSGQTGYIYDWRNPDSGNSGAVIPKTDPYKASTGQTCRDFTQSVTIKNGQTSKDSGTACKQADGTWKIVSGS